MEYCLIYILESILIQRNFFSNFNLLAINKLLQRVSILYGSSSAHVCDGELENPELWMCYKLNQLNIAAPVVSSASSDSSLPVLLTESRSHNTEVRLVLSKVQNKLDTMSQKVWYNFLT